MARQAKMDKTVIYVILVLVLLVVLYWIFTSMKYRVHESFAEPVCPSYLPNTITNCKALVRSENCKIVKCLNTHKEDKNKKATWTLPKTNPCKNGQVTLVYESRNPQIKNSKDKINVVCVTPNPLEDLKIKSPAKYYIIDPEKKYDCSGGDGSNQLNCMVGPNDTVKYLDYPEGGTFIDFKDTDKNKCGGEYQSIKICNPNTDNPSVACAIDDCPSLNCSDMNPNINKAIEEVSYDFDKAYSIAHSMCESNGKCRLNGWQGADGKTLIDCQTL